LKARRKEIDKREDRAEPSDLSRQVHEGAAAIDTSNARIAISEPIQSRIQSARIEYSRSTEKRKVAGELRKGVGDEEGIGKSSTAKTSGREGSRLDDSGSHRKEMGMSVEGERDSTELRSDREPRNGAVGEEEMATGASSGGWCETGISDGETGRRTEADRKVRKESVIGVRRDNGGETGNRRRKWNRRGDRSNANAERRGGKRNRNDSGSRGHR
jgi:hypothetical protein